MASDRLKELIAEAQELARKAYQTLQANELDETLELLRKKLDEIADEAE